MARQGENFPMKLNTNKTLYKCDRCSKEFWWSCSTVPAEISFYQDKDQYVHWHLCPQCAGELHDVIAGNEKKDDDSIRHIHNLEIEKRNLKSRKCLFEGCTNMTDHNGGYCCAEHCKQDRINKKQSLKTVIKNQSAFAQ